MPLVPKLSAGYFAAPGMDLIDLFIGAEGTLGVITEAELRIAAAGAGLVPSFVTFPRRRVWPLVRPQTPGGIQADMGRQAGLGAGCVCDRAPRRQKPRPASRGSDRRAARPAARPRGAARPARHGRPASADGRQRRLRSVVVGGIGGKARLWPPSRISPRCSPPRTSSRRTIVAAPGDRAVVEKLYTLREAVPLAVNARIKRAQLTIDRRIEKTAGRHHRSVQLFDADARLLRRGVSAA